MTAIFITPRATEKAYGLSANNVYAFNVPMSANKKQIAEAVESQFSVKVTGVKVIVQTGKAVRFSRGKHRFPGKTTRQDTKKAYVTLASGDRLTVFDAPENKETK